MCLVFRFFLGFFLILINFYFSFRLLLFFFSFSFFSIPFPLVFSFLSSFFSFRFVYFSLSFHLFLSFPIRVLSMGQIEIYNNSLNLSSFIHEETNCVQIKLLAFGSNTLNHLTVCKRMNNVELKREFQIAILHII